MKRAIIFYSLTGNTKDAAELIAEKLSADLVQIELVKPMPSTMGKQMMLGGMQSTFGMCPKIKGVPANLAEYDEIILGTPIWASKVASPINTLLKEKGLKEKITAVFTFSGGGDNDKCIKCLLKVLPNIKNNVALADRGNNLSEGNNDKIEKFVGNILGE